MDTVSEEYPSESVEHVKENCPLEKETENEKNESARKTQSDYLILPTKLAENQSCGENESSLHISKEESRNCENFGFSRTESEKRIMKPSQSPSPRSPPHEIEDHSGLMLDIPCPNSSDIMEGSKPDFSELMTKEIESLITMNLTPMTPASEEPNIVTSPAARDLNALFTKMDASKVDEDTKQRDEDELYFTASDNEDDEELTPFNWDLLPRFSLPSLSVPGHFEIESYSDHFEGIEDEAFQRYELEPLPTRPKIWWNIPNEECKEIDYDHIEQQDARPDHMALEATHPNTNDNKAAESSNFTPMDAQALMLSLRLDAKVKAKETAAEPTISRSEMEKRERIDALDNLLKQIDNLDVLACEDYDPATLRSMVRQSWSTVSKDTLALMVSVHLVNVCKLLVESPLSARRYIQFCDSNKKYQLALGDKRQNLVKKLLDIFPVQSSKPSEFPVQQDAATRTYVRTTIACQTNQLCSDANLRKVCEKLENTYSVRCIERSLEPMVSFAFDEKSVSILATLPIPEGLQATSQWSSKLAKWLVLEGYIFETINIICIIAQPHAATRTAVRNLGSTIAMLGKPVPKAKIFLAQDSNDAALLVRTLIDTCAGDDHMWYRQRDRLPDYISPETAIQLTLLQAFPRMTCLGAEISSMNSTPAHFLQTSLVDANIGPILLEPTCPVAKVPIVVPPPDVSMHYEAEDAPIPILEPTMSPAEQTPIQQPRRKRRLTLTKQRGDSQMRLDWQYLQEENIE